MRISEAGQNRLASKIDNPCFVATKFFGVRVCAYEKDAILLYRDRFRARLLLVYCVNVSVNRNKIDIFGGVHVSKGKYQEKETAPKEDARSLRFHLTVWRSFDVISFADCSLFRIRKSDGVVFYRYEIGRRILFCPRRTDS